MKIDRTGFFPRARSSVFRGSMTQSQVDGLNALLDMCEQLGVVDPRYIAYILATAFHETGGKMQPVRENEGRPYGHPPAAYWHPGKHNGQIPYGRGLVQTTWDFNYEKTDELLGLHGALLANYDLLITDANLAARALVIGSRDGWYTGKSLKDYFNAHTTDFLNARAIINGKDCEAQIAAYARNLLASIGEMKA